MARGLALGDPVYHLQEVSRYGGEGGLHIMDAQYMHVSIVDFKLKVGTSYLGIEL